MSEAAPSLHENELFAGLAQVQIQDLLSLGSELAVSAGDLIFREGEAGDGMYLVIEGQIRVVTGEEPIRRELALLRAGHVLGEMSLLEDSARSADAFAVSDARLLHVGRDGFSVLLDSQDAAAYQVLRNLAGILAGRLRRMNAGLC